MNKLRYDSLPPDLRKVIAANSGQAVAQLAGQMWDDQAVAVAEQVKAKGNTIATLTSDETARWHRATEPVIENWVKQMRGRGQDGAKILANARELLAKHERT